MRGLLNFIKMILKLTVILAVLGLLLYGFYTGMDFIFRGILSTLLMTLSFEKEISFSDDTITVNALDTIRKKYMTPLSVSDLASEAGFDVHYFIRRFKQVMGMTPYAYLRSYRLIKAAELIGGGMSITRASEQDGYESPAALSRALKQNVLK